MKEKFSFLKDKKNRKIVINIVAVIALLCIAVGISFAGGYWSYTSSNDNTLESGSVSLTYLESTSEINLTNALPMSDKDGKLLSKKGAKFEFAVTTNSDYSQVINYDINIEPLVVDTGLTGLDPSAVKVYLEDKEGNQLVSPVKLSELNNFNLYSTKHTHKKGGTKITSKYVLKAWIDKDVVASDWYKEYKNNNTKYQYKFRVNVNLFKVLITSIKTSIETLINIFGIITFFLIIINILFKTKNIITIPLIGILEMTSGLKYLSLSNIDYNIKVLLSMFLISFGGFSVHFQIMSILHKKKVKYLPFLISRIIHGIISVLILITIIYFL